MPAPGLFRVDSAEARAAARAVQEAGWRASVKIQDATETTMTAAYGEEIAASRGTPVQQTVIGTGASSHGSAWGLEMRANLGVRLRNGQITPEMGRGWEFGSLHAGKKTTYTQRSRKGNRYTVTRQSDRQMPNRSQRGWVAYPAASKVFHRVLEMWLQILVKVSHDAVETRR